MTRLRVDSSFAARSLDAQFSLVLQARRIIGSKAQKTPVLSSARLNKLVGAEVFLKCENFQHGGSFKFRGAFNAISALDETERSRGLVTYSSGNHGQAVALVGRLMGLSVTVVMPRNASEIKRAAIVANGARVVDCDPADREMVARALQQDYGSVLIPPFDHPLVIAGQGTLAMEFHQQTPDLDAIIAPVGGGGLISGVAIATKSIRPACKIIGVEPELCDDASRSLKSGVLQHCDGCSSIADGVRTRSLGDITFPIVCRNVDQIVTVDEQAIVDAVGFLSQQIHLMVEPTGALGVAALLSGRYRPAGRVGVVLSGGNIDQAAISGLAV